MALLSNSKSGENVFQSWRFDQMFLTTWLNLPSHIFPRGTKVYTLLLYLLEVVLKQLVPH